ncbi:hypothetical protein L6232_25805, partial [Shewanella sp. C31]|nr:hypothetical protein [Shewanella electrica]
AEDPWAEPLHQVEPFGPVATFFPYRSREEALRLARLGGGMLVATVATLDPGEARFWLLGLSGEVGPEGVSLALEGFRYGPLAL